MPSFADKLPPRSQTVAEKISNARDEIHQQMQRGYTQQQIAAALGVNRNTFRMYWMQIRRLPPQTGGQAA